MADPPSTRKYICNQCGQHYSSASHLRRHNATHTTDRPASCAFCHRTFIRSLVMFCFDTHGLASRRVHGQYRQESPAGNAKHATHVPRLALHCSYTSAQKLSASPCNEHTDTPEESETSNPQRIPISFLLDYTNPTIRSAYDFHHMLAEHNARIPKTANQERRGSVMASDHVVDAWPFLFYAFINSAAVDPPIQPSGLMYGTDEDARLAETIDRLIVHLEQSPAPNAGTKFSRARARLFFSKDNIIRFVNAFFDIVYNSNPIIYRASFNITTTSLNLVLAVLLIGATCLSPEDAGGAEEFYHATEYCIFEGTEFRRILYEEENPCPSADNIQLIQASILIMLQGFKGPLEVRRRVRIQRFPALVSIVRLLGMTKAVNDTVLGDELSNLREYIHKETLVRLMAWIYLVDTHVVIFSRLPPQFRISEAQFGLPQQDAIFNAVDPTRLNHLASNFTRHQPVWTLQSAVQQLTSDEPAGFEELRPHIDTFFAHFLLIGALHSILFDIQALQSCIDIPGALMPVERALNRWKSLWDQFQRGSDPPETTSSGFMAYSLEYWWLAKMLVKEPRLFDKEEAAAADSVDAFHSVIKRLKMINAE
ncbi:hypothetical protein HFD88_010435 [Aspergillus terreus]|nr:hypothetical protein HFD88_010435 [Aspergillus terreus]